MVDLQTMADAFRYSKEFGHFESLHYQDNEWLGPPQCLVKRGLLPKDDLTKLRSWVEVEGFKPVDMKKRLADTLGSLRRRADTAPTYKKAKVLYEDIDRFGHEDGWNVVLWSNGEHSLRCAEVLSDLLDDEVLLIEVKLGKDASGHYALVSKDLDVVVMPLAERRRHSRRSTDPRAEDSEYHGQTKIVMVKPEPVEF